MTHLLSWTQNKIQIYIQGISPRLEFCQKLKFKNWKVRGNRYELTDKKITFHQDSGRLFFLTKLKINLDMDITSNLSNRSLVRM